MSPARRKARKGRPQFQLLLVAADQAAAASIEALLGGAPGAAFQVERVGDLAGGMARLEARPFDAALLALPEDHALEALERLRARFPALPCLVLCEREDAALERRALALGAQDCLPREGLDGAALSRALRHAQERARERELLLRQAAALAALYETSLDLITSPDLDGLLNGIATRAMQLLEGGSAGVYLCEPEHQRLRYVASTDVAKKYLGTVLPYGVGAAGLVAQTGEPLLIDDYRTWKGRARAFEKDRPFSAVASAPMSWRGQVTGVINVTRDLPARTFTPEDLALLIPFAMQAAVAVEHARLYHQARDLAAFQEGIVQNMGGGVAVTDLDGKLTFVNQTLLEMLGYARAADLAGRHWTAIFPPEAHARVQAVDEERARGEAGHYEIELQHADGTRLHALVSGSPRHDQDGRFQGTIALLTDISERVQAEHALQASEQRLWMAGQAAYDLIYEWDARSDDLEVFGDLEGLLGYPEGIFARDISTFLALVHPEDRDTLAASVEAHRTTSDPIQREYRIRHKDGSYRVWEDRALPLLDGGGRPHRWVGVCRDVTEMVVAQRALQESERRLQTLMGNLPGMAYRCLNERPWPMMFLSQGCLELTGYAPEEFIPGGGLDYNELIHPDDRQRVWETIQQAVAGGCAFQLEYRLLPRGGGEKWVWEQGIAVGTDERGRTLLEGFITDVTMRVQFEREMRERSQDLELLNLINAAVNRGANLKETTNLLTTEARRVFECDTITFYLVSEDDRYLEMQNLSLPAKTVRQIESLIGKPIPEIRIPLEQSTLFKSLLESGDPRYFDTPEAIQDYLSEFINTITLPRKLRAGMRRLVPRFYEIAGAPYMLTLPLVLDGRPAGLLDLTRREPFPPGLVRRAALVAGGLATAVNRLRGEQALLESEARYRSIFEASAIGMVTADNHGRLLTANAAACDMLGYTREALLDRTFLELTHPEDVESNRRRFANCIKDRQPYTIQKRYLTQEGGTRVALTTVSPVFDAEGGFRYAVAQLQDITERVQAEQSLSASHERLLMVLDSLDADIYVADMHTHEVLFMNEHMRASFGKDMVGLACWKAFRGYEGPCPHCNNERLVDARGEPAGVLTWEGQNPLTGRWYTNHDRAIRWVDDRLVRMQIATDITGRVESEQQVRDYARQVEALLQIERAVTSSLELDEVLATILEELAGIIPHDSGSVQILVEDRLEILACRGFERPEALVGLSFPHTGDFPNQRALDARASLAIADVRQEYPHFEAQVQAYQSGKIRSWLGVPLVSKGEALGMITLDRAEVVPFSQQEIELATAVANQAVLPIENARLYRDAQQRLERLAALRHIDETISNSLDMRLTLNVLLSHVLGQLEVDAAAVLLYRPELQTLEFVAGHGFRAHALKYTNLRLGEGFAGRAALERRTVQVLDADELQAGFQASPQLREEGFAAYIGVPLVAKGNVTGVLEIFHRGPLAHDREWMAFLETMAWQAAIAIDNIRLFEGLQRSNIELVQAYDATIEGWARALELRDMETEGHSRRVVDLTMKLAQKMDFPEDLMNHLYRGALLHDIGKMGVPDSLLGKPGQLSEAEWQVMRQHPVHAYRWLSKIRYLQPALDIPYCHHERWDGSGYPRGLQGEQIPLAARIFAVVDVWDALLSDRPYRAAWPREQAVAYLREGAGTLFDPHVVAEFLELLAELEAS